MSQTDALFHSFETTRQEPVRLNLALQLFFRGDASPEQTQKLEAYLKRRIRSALEVLLREDDLPGLKRLASAGWLNEGLVEDGLKMAISLKKTEGYVWFLRLKAEKYGFRDRDFSL